MLTKPGIIFGNVLSATAGFLLASKFRIDIKLFAATIVGMALVIAAACVYNNYIDRDIDQKMARTKKRALASGRVPAGSALAYATMLFVLGFAILGGASNALVVGIGLVAFVDYVALYGLAKRHSVHGTVVGSISGAAPVVAGYAAVTDRLDLGALLLFAIWTLWQMPHFYAIAMYRFDDYKAAGLPVLPVKKGMRAAKIQIVWYVAAFIVANAFLTICGYTGLSYLAVLSLLGLYWLWRGLQGFHTKNDRTWARSMFLLSLMVMLGLCLMLSIGALLP